MVRRAGQRRDFGRVVDDEGRIPELAFGHFLEEGTRRRPNELVRWYRSGQYLASGDLLVWEYPRQTPDGEQIDILELMQLKDGLIWRHRIYWGWFGTQMLIQSALSKA